MDKEEKIMSIPYNNKDMEGVRQVAINHIQKLQQAISEKDKEIERLKEQLRQSCSIEIEYEQLKKDLKKPFHSDSKFCFENEHDKLRQKNSLLKAEIDRLEKKCPKCGQNKYSICAVQCSCDLLNNGIIDKKEYHKHLKLRVLKK